MTLPRKLQYEYLRAGSLTFLSVAAYPVAYLIRFSGDLQGEPGALLQTSLGWAFAIKLAAILYFRLHQGWSQYATLHDAWLIAKTSAAATTCLTLIDTFVVDQGTIPRSVLLLDWGVSTFMLGAVRGLPRLIRDRRSIRRVSHRDIRALIVGANDSGEGLLRAIVRAPNLTYQPVGFVDNRPELHGRTIAGVPVLGSLDQLPALVEEHAIDEVLVNAGEIPGKQLRALIDVAEEGEFRVKVLPSYEQLLDGRVQFQPRPAAITDLLQRPSVNLDVDRLKSSLQGRTLMVTGAAGSIGSEICRQLLKCQPARLLLVDRNETGQFFLERELSELDPQVPIEAVMADLTDQDRLHAIFEQYHPEIVFHAAAYKHVPLMESHPGEAVKNIVLATRGLADLAEQFGVQRFVMISTDKAVNPTSVMGSCKRLAEHYVQAKAGQSACRFVTVRFGNVLDSAGSVVPVFREQIARGGPVTVTHPEMVRFFMLIPEAAQLVIQAGAMGQGGEIFVLDMGEPVRIMDLASDMIRLSGLRVGEDIEIRVTGLRPGEKLYEELYDQTEQHQRTGHPKIMVASGEPRNLLSVIYAIGRLEQCVNGPREQVLRQLREIIPVWTADERSTTVAAQEAPATSHPNRRQAA
jgi:FlaA1/EpsC-like NDP-sugar epimerase